MTKVINVDGLNRTSEQYDPVLRVLPFNDLRPRIAAMGFRFLSSDKELREASFERKGAISKPYVKGTTNPVGIDALGKVKESKLVPEWGHTSLVEDIMNYEDLNVITNAPERVDPVTKRHPQEMLIMSSVVKTVAEDILDALYFAERDEEDPSPLGLFDGINTLVDALVSAGEISAAKGNLYATGAISTPADSSDTTAYDSLVEFLRAANWALKRGGAILKITETIYYYIVDALRNKVKYTVSDPYNALLNQLIGDASFTGLQLSVEPEMGTGDRIYLTKPQNFDFSLWTDPGVRFVQVRNIYENPNLVQYWNQWKAGSRVRLHHQKMFLMNDGTATGQQLSGDYLS